VSFDTPAENKAFREKFDFPFHLLCDVDRTVGEAYQAKREPGHQYEAYAQRVSYLIDPEGFIRRAYEVTDPAGHAEVVLADLRELAGG
jgi:thioredoxin-dependent peroxiredoxin